MPPRSSLLARRAHAAPPYEPRHAKPGQRLPTLERIPTGPSGAFRGLLVGLAFTLLCALALVLVLR